MKPSVSLKHWEGTGPDSAVVTFEMTLGKTTGDLAAIVTRHPTNAPGRQAYPGGGYIEVTGVAPLLAAPLAEAIVRFNRDEFDYISTDNRLKRLLRKPLVKLRNRRLRATD